MFYLRHPEKTDEMLQLEVTFVANSAEEGDFENSKAVWIKGGKPDATTQAPPLEVFHIRMHSGISWQLKISAENIIDMSRVTPRMDEFAQGVRFREPPEDENPAFSGYKVFISPSSLPVVGMEQKTTFRFSLKAHPSSVFELSRYDEYNGVDPKHPSSTQWAASFHDREWDVKLSENAGLSVGQFASWNPQTTPFFQPMHGSINTGPHAGFADIFHQIHNITNFLDTLKGTSPDPEETSDANSESETIL
ncbi:MAG: hypothetical protein Q9170_003372 [Blastenia crenularia]